MWHGNELFQKLDIAMKPYRISMKSEAEMKPGVQWKPASWALFDLVSEILLRIVLDCKKTKPFGVLFGLELWLDVSYINLSTYPR